VHFLGCLRCQLKISVTSSSFSTKISRNIDNTILNSSLEEKVQNFFAWLPQGPPSMFSKENFLIWLDHVTLFDCGWPIPYSRSFHLESSPVEWRILVVGNSSLVGAYSTSLKWNEVESSWNWWGTWKTSIIFIFVRARFFVVIIVVAISRWLSTLFRPSNLLLQWWLPQLLKMASKHIFYGCLFDG